MERKRSFPGVGWLSSRLRVKFILVVVLLCLVSCLPCRLTLFGPWRATS